MTTPKAVLDLLRGTRVVAREPSPHAGASGTIAGEMLTTGDPHPPLLLRPDVQPETLLAVRPEHLLREPPAEAPAEAPADAAAGPVFRIVHAHLTTHEDLDTVGFRYEAYADPQPELRFVSGGVVGYSDHSPEEALAQLGLALAALGVEARARYEPENAAQGLSDRED